MNLLRKLLLFVYRTEIEDTIFQAELMSESTGMDSSLILEGYSKKIKNKFQKEEIGEIVRKLRLAHKKNVVYKDYLSPEVVRVLELGQNNKMREGTMLSEYAPIRRIAQSNIKAIRSSLMVPLVLFVIVVLLLRAVGTDLAQSESSIEYSWVSLFILHNFTLINSLLFILMVVGFFIFPHRVPIISKAYKKIDALLAVSLVDLTLQSAKVPETMRLLQDQFSLPRKQGRGDIAELVLLMEEANFISNKDAADLEMAGRYGDIYVMITEKKEDKIAEAKRFGDVIGEITKNLGNVMYAIPGFQFAIVLMNIMSASVGKIQ